MLLKLRYYFRLTLAFISKFKGIFLIGILFGILVFFFINFISPKFFNKKTQKIGYTGRFHTEDLPNEILELISNGLTKINKNGEVEPDIAASWSTPDKGKTWIFTLKDDITWQDEQKLTSADLNYNFSDVKIEKPDDKTIIFELNDEYSPFPAVVAKPVFRQGLLGTGDWKVNKISVAGGYVQELIITNTSGDKKIFKFYPNEERTKLAFKLGQVDVIENTFDPHPFENWSTAKIEQIVKQDAVVTLFFNTQDETLSDKSIRQALTYAINKKSFNAPRALSPVNSSSWAYNPQVKGYDYDQERAKELLDDLPDQVKNNLNIRLVTTPVLLPVAESISKMWQDVGINSNVLVSSVVPNDFQVFLAILDIPDDPDQYSIWHSTQTASNISKYQNPRIDKLLEDGRVELDLENRRKIYLDFQRFLLEDVPAAFLYNPPVYKITRK
jgi:peptide/nickel transport system substrate-binding protein